MRRQLELRDLRSLERRSMYSIFKPLDPNERLPRELILEGKRYRFLEKGTLLTIVGVLYLPILMLSVVVLGSLQVGMLAAFGIAGLMLAAAYVYALKAR
jgi:hypothetical protein